MDNNGKPSCGSRGDLMIIILFIIIIVVVVGRGSWGRALTIFIRFIIRKWLIQTYVWASTYAEASNIRSINKISSRRCEFTWNLLISLICIFVHYEFDLEDRGCGKFSRFAINRNWISKSVWVSQSDWSHDVHSSFIWYNY